MTDSIQERLTAAATSQGPRLRAFVRRQVGDLMDAEDIVQDVLAELVAAFRVTQIEQVAAWLFRAARNRIIDRFRSRARDAAVIDRSAQAPGDGTTASAGLLADWLAPTADGPEAAYARALLIDQLAAALEELPSEQRETFIAHELEGQSFKQLAAASGVSVNRFWAASTPRYCICADGCRTSDQGSRLERSIEDLPMRRFRFLRGLKFVAVAALAVAVFGVGVMWLWNAVVPALTGWHALGFWRAVGLLLLCRILFGGWRGRSGGWHWRQRLRERFERMSPQEQERLRQSMRQRCAFPEQSDERSGPLATPE
jgi:RNA polymerase sigma factor (sigma-70 family)